MLQIKRPEESLPLTMEPSIEEEHNFEFDVMIRDLPTRQRLILSLIYRHEWKRTEIGKLLGISSMRVGQVEQQALKKLKTDTQVVKRTL